MSDAMTRHKTHATAEECRKTAQNSALCPDKGKEGYRLHTVSDSPSAGTATRISRKHLLELEPVLSDTDWKILRTIRMCRVMLGRQIGRLYFSDSKTQQASVRATNRRLKKLSDEGLITALNQKINVHLKGYSAHIYYLTEAGECILRLHLHEPEVRKRNMEPSPGTLVHTLSVAECYVQTVEACRADDMKLSRIDLEPDCWKPYQKSYKNCILKPDLAIVTEKQDWLDHDEPWDELRWFIEVDLNTESIQTIMEKCRRYYDYYKADVEQRLHDDVFPLVVWIVKTESRRQSIIRHIQETFRKYPRIFAVILPDEFHPLLRDELKEAEEYICPD